MPAIVRQRISNYRSISGRNIFERRPIRVRRGNVSSPSFFRASRGKRTPALRPESIPVKKREGTYWDLILADILELTGASSLELIQEELGKAGGRLEIVLKILHITNFRSLKKRFLTIREIVLDENARKLPQIRKFMESILCIFLLFLSVFPD